MAFNQNNIDGIKKNGEELHDTEGGIGGDPLTHNSDLTSQEGVKPAKTQAGGDDGFYNRIKNKGIEGAKDKAGVKGGEDQSMAKTAKEATKLATDIEDGNWAAAAKNAWKNRKAYMKGTKKLVLLGAIGVVGFMIAGMVIFSLIFNAVGGALKGVTTAVEKATGYYYAKAAWTGEARLVNTGAKAGWHALFGENTQPPKTKLGKELATLDINKSFQQLARFGTQETRGPPASNTTFASTDLMSKATNLADMNSSLKGTKLNTAASNLNSTIKYSDNKVTINGTEIDIPPEGSSNTQLKKYYEKVTNVLQVSDPFKLYASVPQLASFKSKISQQYNISSEAWQDKGQQFDGLSNKDAFKKTQQNNYSEVTGNSINSRTSSLPFVQKLQDEIKANLTTAVSDGKADPIQVAENDAINKFIINNVFKSSDIDSNVLAGYSLCLVNDMDLGAQQSTSAMVPSSIRQAAAFGAAADQTVSGDLHGNELGANLNLYGDMYNQGNYQRTIFNKSWSNAGAYKQLPQNSYQQFLNQTPPAGMFSALKAIVEDGLGKSYSLVSVGGVHAVTSHPTKKFINDKDHPCGSTNDIASSVSPSYGFTGIFSVFNFLTSAGKKNQIMDFIGQVQTTMEQYIVQDNNLGLTALAQIPGSVFSSSVKLGFSYLLKSTVMNNLGINYAGVSNNNYTNQVVSGFSLLGGEEARKMAYGRPLTLGENNQIKSEQLADHKIKMDHMSVFARMTDLNSSYSLASQMAVASTGWRNNALGQITASIAHSFSFVSQPSSLLASAGQMAFNNSGVTRDNIAYAADDPNAFVSSQFPDPSGGNLHWGWSQAETNTIQSSASYGMLQNAKIVEGWEGNPDSHQAKYINTIKPCFDGDVSKIVTDPGLNKKGHNTCEDMKGNNTALRYRLYMSDQTMISDLKDLQTVTQDSSASSSTAGAEIDTAHLYDDSTSVACAPNTQDVGTQDGYRSGTLIKIKLCAIPGLPSSGEESHSIAGANGNAVVNSRISGAVYALVQAAAKDGINLSANSSFRTMAHQQSLWAQNPNPIAVAKPGTSNHQMGLAIDYTMANPAKFNDSRLTCVNVGGRCEAPGDKVWEWLEANAGKFGIKPYVNEYWHWSPSGN